MFVTISSESELLLTRCLSCTAILMMTADIMTKGLGTVKFRKFRDGLGVFDVDHVF